MSDEAVIDYATWDWLPKAAREMEAYVVRLLEEAGVKPHDVSARAKSIASFQRKCKDKQYDDPSQQATDTVAIRVITYSKTDRERASELIRSRFLVKDGEDRNPGNEKSDRRRGYDCQHIVVSSENPGVDGDWLVSGGALAMYFEKFGGLEIQVRTVASHAWAEFEHARRYKGAQYEAISAQDKETIDQLFGAASDSRKALDETFVAIERILARPSMDSSQGDDMREPEEEVFHKGGTPLDEDSLCVLLESRFPDDRAASAKGNGFGLELARLCGLETVESLESIFEAVDSEQIRALMDTTGPVTRVRRLDDELLAYFEDEYIRLTGTAGSVGTRAQQLEWRFDRLRGKARYNTYFFHGEDCPDDLKSGGRAAARVVRELAVLVAQAKGTDAVTQVEGVSDVNDLQRGTRAREVPVSSDESIWVITNLNRDYSESLMKDLLAQAPDLDVQVTRDKVLVAGNSRR